METLLRNDFTSHYGLPVVTVANLSIRTNAAYFEIEDVSNQPQVHLAVGVGTAVYRNNPPYDVEIINHDAFITSLPAHFQHGQERCDLIVFTPAVNRYFLLNELSDTDPAYIDFTDPLGVRRGKRIKAASQLFASLLRIMTVPTINTFVNNYIIRRCCFFNKRAIAPALITATTSFNLVNTIVQDGFRISNVDIESLGFEFFEYSGGLPFVLN